VGRLDPATTIDAEPVPRAGEQPGIPDHPTGAVRLNGHPDRRLHTTLNISVTAVIGNHLLAAVAGRAEEVVRSVLRPSTPVAAMVNVEGGHR